ncbi:related to conserved hypothetical Ustilaginaceae-specific protein [Ustilago trichophora]|uniref:Related to conserved hypothetical Ustilaginaceae-specific protein n=1 Tax=Ustilago trichophora TaxID=86804 RepID=A0A5C3ERP1_9BASI|nr:related to conserved hypothetical Ustilaginaceae-specific protein [Ustilago trichophora]
MQVLQLLSIFTLLGEAYTLPTLEKRKQARAECIRQKAQETADEAKAKFIDISASICYHGSSSASDPNSLTTNKTEGAYKYVGYKKCDKIGSASWLGSDVICSSILYPNSIRMDCLWLMGKNEWKGYKDAGSDNLAIIHTYNHTCLYDKQNVQVSCLN